MYLHFYKEFHTSMKKILILLLTAGLIYGCTGKKDKNAQNTGEDSIDISELPDTLQSHPASTTTQVHITEANKDSILMDMTKEALSYIKNKQYSKLDSLVHPEKGIRFSPYATVDASTDKKFSKEEFAALFTTNKNKKYNWGSYDGSGDPILLTAPQYFNKFVYDANFLDPQKAGVNKVFKEGNSINNLESFYKDADFTESHFTGSRKSSGLDWKSVRLVFQQYNGRYYLVGIVHDGWTI